MTLPTRSVRARSGCTTPCISPALPCISPYQDVREGVAAVHLQTANWPAAEGLVVTADEREVCLA